jgi:hypothetical protein
MNPYTNPHPPRGGAAHRQAEWREYHPVSWSAGMRVGRQKAEGRRQKAESDKPHTVLQFDKLTASQFGKLTASHSCGLTVLRSSGRAGSISMSLDFFGTFCIKTKSTESCGFTGHEHYPPFGGDSIAVGLSKYILPFKT